MYLLLLREEVKMFEEFKQNLMVEKEIINQLKGTLEEKKKNAYLNQLRVLNGAIPELLKKTSPVKSISSAPVDLVSVNSVVSGKVVLIRKEDVPVYGVDLKSLVISSKELKKSNESYSVVKPSLIRSLSNRFFRGTAERYLPRFRRLSDNIKMANLSILPSTYLAIMFFITFCSVFFGIGIYVVLLVLSFDYWTYFWVVFLVPTVTFAGFYFYPGSEAGTVQKAIAYELPFATIHMAAIAGAEVEPTKIFQIIANSKEYPTVGFEMQKIIVLIRLYGYDLVTSLKNVARRTSSPKLAELLGGLATNISGGGELKNYLSRKSENLLLDYRLERTKYIDIASTFMDIYISILIAAPMVLMLMFIIMNVAGLGFEGYSINFLMIISIVVIIIVNILFIIVINFKQPKV